MPFALLLLATLFLAPIAAYAQSPGYVSSVQSRLLSSSGKPDTVTAPAGWASVKVREGGYSVLMPGAPVDQVQEVPTSQGVLQNRMKVVQAGEGTFMTGYVDYPENSPATADAAAFFDGYVNTVLASVGGAVAASAPVLYGAHPGMAVTINAPDKGLAMEARTYLVGDRQHALAYVHPVAARDSAAAARFFSSFALDLLAGKPRLSRFLDQQGYQYQVKEDGSHAFVLEFDDGRSQLLTITPGANSVSGRHYWDVWSVVSRSAEPPAPDFARAALEWNGRYLVGAYQLHMDSEGAYLLVLSHPVDPSVSAESLEKVFQAIAGTADEVEKGLTGKDDE